MCNATIHQFEIAGLGKAPFRWVGMRENAFTIPGTGINRAGGSCDFCGTGIRFECVIESADGKRHVVGTDCIRKVGDKGLVDAVKRAKREAKRAREQAELEVRLQEQRDRNGGKTDHEIKMARQAAARAEREAEVDRIMTPVIEILAPLAERIRDGKGRFRDDVARTMEMGQVPFGRGFDLVVEILAKQAGRRGSKAFDAEADKISAALESAEAARESADAALEALRASNL